MFRTPQLSLLLAQAVALGLLVLVSNGLRPRLLNGTSGCAGQTESTFAPDACSFDTVTASH